MKKNKGVTLVSLILTIIIMLMLVGVTINIGSNMIERVKAQEIYTQLEIVHSAMISIKEKNPNIGNDEMNKDEEGYITYTPKQIKSFGIDGINYNVLINWNTMQVKTNYNGQEYTLKKYETQGQENYRVDTDFNISIEYNDNRYKVTVIPEDTENKSLLEVAYRKKVEEGEIENNWILVSGFDFEFVQYGNYEVRVKEKNNVNLSIRTITQQIDTVNANEQVAILEGTLGEKLINYKIYGKSVQNDVPSPDNPVDIQNVGDNGKIEVTVADNDYIYNTIEDKYRININNPLRKIDDTSDYIEYNTRKLIRNIKHTIIDENVELDYILENPYEEIVNVPDIFTKMVITYISIEDENIGQVSGEYTYIKTEII